MTKRLTGLSEGWNPKADLLRIIRCARELELLAMRSNRRDEAEHWARHAKMAEDFAVSMKQND